MRGCLVRLAKSLGVWVGVSVVVMVGLGVCLSVEHWDWLNQDGDPSATIRNAGLVVAAPVALVLAAWRSVVAERQSETAEKNLINEQFQVRGRASRTPET